MAPVVVRLKPESGQRAQSSGNGRQPEDPRSGCLADLLAVDCRHHAGGCDSDPANLNAPCTRRLGVGQHLFWAGDPAEQIWLVREGSLKTYGIAANSDERVTGFFFAGDIVGWDALACGVFQFNAMALEPTAVARVTAPAVLDGALKSPQIQGRLLDGIRAEFVRLEAMLWLDHSSAEARLAAFLLWVADAQLRHGGALDDISLPMSRHDIGSYLGLATETVSRRLSMFHRNGWITLRRRRIHINDPQHLQRLSKS